ncbi:MAG: bifunctional phosphopantothenoylcysteine decarboxylase/phosphopantothenate--cysteine ligase CoaBC [Gammaproteobacteria bacterium]|nr:bifunctional phosphopantothenoylcysteine decarboxylase/phosphopantothenate--cysteine ligase CoaBC [Gammaproteobacteria bacterium]
MQDFHRQHILVGVSGGIAAYKTAVLVRELKTLGAEVKVVMTESATHFVTPLTFQTLSGHPVQTQLWEEGAPQTMEHIHLARWADLFIIVPATANILAKMAHGIADDLLSTLYLVTNTPVMVCPAMNQSMWQHPATQANIQLLKSRQVRIIDPEDGEAACGESGIGRLCEPHHLLQYLRLYDMPPVLSGQHCIITAGPTRERLDPVRYLSNDSSGKMGYALAYAANMAGATVTLISGPTALPPAPGVQFIQTESAQHMSEAVTANLTKDCIFIGAAAVADFSPTTLANEKIKKHQQQEMQLHCARTPDILSQVVNSKLARYVVGFAAETQNMIQHAKEKLQAKHLDLIIANEVGNGKGFEQEHHTATLITSHEELALPLQHKTRLAGDVIRYIGKQSRVDKGASR